MRKRKRNAVDPSLGYYASEARPSQVSFASTSRNIGVVNQSVSKGHVDALGALKVLLSMALGTGQLTRLIQGASSIEAVPSTRSVEDSSKEVLGVEEFLKRVTRGNGAGRGGQTGTGAGGWLSNGTATTGQAKTFDRRSLVCIPAQSPCGPPIQTGTPSLLPDGTGEQRAPLQAAMHLALIAKPRRARVQWALEEEGEEKKEKETNSEPYDLPTPSGSFPPIATLHDSSSEDEEELNTQFCLRSRSFSRRQVIASDSEESALYSTSSRERHASASEFDTQSPPRLARKKRKRLKTKTLGARLFEASVAANGDPLDSLVVPPPPRTPEDVRGHSYTKKREQPPQTQRKPLKFQRADTISATLMPKASVAASGAGKHRRPLRVLDPLKVANPFFQTQSAFHHSMSVSAPAHLANYPGEEDAPWDEERGKTSLQTPARSSTLMPLSHSSGKSRSQMRSVTGWRPERPASSNPAELENKAKTKMTKLRKQGKRRVKGSTKALRDQASEGEGQQGSGLSYRPLSFLPVSEAKAPGMVHRR